MDGAAEISVALARPWVVEPGVVEPGDERPKRRLFGLPLLDLPRRTPGHSRGERGPERDPGPLLGGLEDSGQAGRRVRVPRERSVLEEEGARDARCVPQRVPETHAALRGSRRAEGERGGFPASGRSPGSLARWFAAALLLAMGRPALAQRALVVRGDLSARWVDPRLVGIFLEEIDHAGEGGLYAELIRNRTFEEPGEGIPGWAIELAPGAEASIDLDRDRPCSAATPTSLRLRIAKGAASAVNRGHFGLSLRREEEYRIRLDARAEGGLDPDLALTLDGPDGSVLARADLGPLAAEWRHFEAAIPCPADADGAALSITARGPGTLWIDDASMFPSATFRERPFGLRRDLGRLLARIRPGFVRFPGGCFVEGGDHLADAFRWEKTLGGVADRPGHRNAAWGYWSSDGLGFLEYLELCEDLGARPLFVVNCGMSHEETVPIENLEPWIDSAVSAVEFATAPPDRGLGRRRAELGHPRPFPVPMIEIGNENGCFAGFGGTRADYEARYALFAKAFAARFQDVLLIADTDVRGAAVVDEHHYGPSSWFWSQVHRYDARDRNGPKILVGEYAVTEDAGEGNLRAALAEAAFLTGVVRNSDVVILSSYAPLMSHRNDRRWRPTAIVFDGRRCYGTPSYHVQSMFGRNLPRRSFVVEAPDFAAGPGAGTAGLGTWNTSAEFRNVEIEVDGRVVLASSSMSEDQVAFERGDWSFGDGVLRQRAIEEHCWSRFVLSELEHARDYTIRCEARKLGGQEGFLVLVHARSGDDWTWFNAGGWNNSAHGLERSGGGLKADLAPRVPGRIETGRWYRLSVACKDGRIETSIDGEKVHDAKDRGRPTFAAAAGLDRDDALVLFAVNGSARPRRLLLEARGIAVSALEAAGEILDGASLDDENDFDHEDRVSPRKVRIDLDGERPSLEFPPRSLSVLRLRRGR
ncbi:MAG: alpha-L-arabinofuranosidase C-terminal domain-containing protein [Planctomycetota bacterium]